MARHYSRKYEQLKQSQGASDERKHGYNETSGGSMTMPPRVEGMTTKDESSMVDVGRRYYGEGYGNMANMPTAPVMKLYPKPYQGLNNDDYPDNIRSIDMDGYASEKEVRDHLSDSMY